MRYAILNVLRYVEPHAICRIKRNVICRTSCDMPYLNAICRTSCDMAYVMRYGIMIWQPTFLLVSTEVEVPDEANDTSVILNLLDECSDGNSASHILNTMSDIQGPWSFIYYQAREGKLWFGRDYFGRRSLVWHLPTDEADVFAVSSVATRTCQENGNNWIAIFPRFVPENEAIDLINVAFEQKQPMPNPTDKKTKRSNAGQSPPNFDVPDRITGRSGLSELAIIHPSRKWNFIEVNVVLQDLQNAR
ncbi:hypothetical protein QZH41_013945 [Actinostola sp. cb2023]|nr:hypothetical protein QZH41_013945 [Actinostola sp. cb2023]